MSISNTNRPHYPALDGLRGIAILLVVLYHNFGFIPFFNYGWLGVDLFFVLSGFLITEILLNTRDTKNYFKTFYTRRMLRIFPLYYLSLVLVIIVFPAIKNFPFNLDFYTKNQVWFWLYLENWLLIFKAWGSSTYILNHFWSLSVEEQFYFVWPLIILLVKRPKYLLWLCFSVLLIVILSRCYIWYNKSSYTSYTYIFLFTRIDGILIGSMLALTKLINYNFLKKYSYLIIFSLATLNFLFYFINRYKQFTFPYWAIVGYTTFSVIFALIAYEAIDRRDKILTFILSIPLLRFLGKISYGFYVFHWPIYFMLYKYTDSWAQSNFRLDGFSLHFFVSLVLTFIAFIISVISYYTYERIWLRLKERYT